MKSLRLKIKRWIVRRCVSGIMLLGETTTFPKPVANPGIISKLYIRIVKAYQADKTLHRTKTCRFVPTCSEYLIESVRKYGLRQGLRKAAVRLRKCVPFGASGVDLP